MIIQATSAAGSAVDASFVKVIPFLLPTHGVFSDGKCLHITPFFSKDVFSRPHFTLSTLQGQRKQIWIQLLEKSLCLANISSDLLYLTHGLIDGFCYIPISQGGQELAKARHTTSDLGALHPHPISQPLPGGLVPAGPCPAPADAQALRLRTPGRMEEGQGRQDRTLPPAPPVLELSISSPRTQ